MTMHTQALSLSHTYTHLNMKTHTPTSTNTMERVRHKHKQQVIASLASAKTATTKHFLLHFLSAKYVCVAMRK